MLEKRWEIGGDAADSTAAFQRVVDIAVDAAGVYVLDAALKRLFIFRTNGEFVRTLGRDGRGPGEFLVPVRVRTDSVLRVFDAAQNRVSVFNRGGNHIETSPMTALGATPFGVLLNVRNGGLVGQQVARFSNAAVENDPFTTLVYLRAEHAAPDTLARFRVGASVVVPTAGSASWGTRAVPMGDAGAWSLMGDSVVVVADGYSGLVRWVRLDSTLSVLRQQSLGLTGVPVSAKDVAAFNDDLRRAGRRLDRADGSSLPPRWSIATSVVIADDATVWVRNGATGEISSVWSVLPADGSILRVRLPDGFRLEAVHRGILYGIARDRLDSEIVVAYRYRLPS